MSALLASLTRALGLHNLDADEIFSYQTTKVVSMLDHRLGLLCWSIRLLVVGYIVGFVFVAKGELAATSPRGPTTAIEPATSKHASSRPIAKPQCHPRSVIDEPRSM